MQKCKFKGTKRNNTKNKMKKSRICDNVILKLLFFNFYNSTCSFKINIYCMLILLTRFFFGYQKMVFKIILLLLLICFFFLFRSFFSRLYSFLCISLYVSSSSDGEKMEKCVILLYLP